tara:strand:- start:631 stop:1296 length:666 start_codon:yes stop_codon:yes gene_type:complete
LVFWREVVGGAEEVDDELGVPHDDRSSDFMVVLDESEALGSEAVGDALLVELLEGFVCLEDSGGGDIADSNGEAVSREVAALEFVGVEVDPLDGEFVVLEGGEVFWGFAGGVDGEGLLGDRVFVFESGVSDGSAVDFEMTREDVAELECGHASFFDVHVDVLAVTCGLVEGEFLDEEVFGAVFDGATDAWGFTGEVDGGGDGGVEGGEGVSWCGGGHGRGL